MLQIQTIQTFDPTKQLRLSGFQKKSFAADLIPFLHGFPLRCGSYSPKNSIISLVPDNIVYLAGKRYLIYYIWSLDSVRTRSRAWRRYRGRTLLTWSGRARSIRTRARSLSTTLSWSRFSFLVTLHFDVNVVRFSSLSVHGRVRREKRKLFEGKVPLSVS